MAEARSAEDHRMHIVRTDGSGRRDLGMGRYPVWSPDGRWIAFTADGGVWIVQPSGRRRQLLASATAVGGLAFSPTGRRLLFTRTAPDGSVMEWWIVPVAGGEPRRVAAQPITFERFLCPPHWTPDGERLAAMRINRDPDGIGRRVFVTSRLDGSDERVEFAVPERYTGDHPCDFSWQRRFR
jgi:Tol biopolymer transport system component